MKTRRYTNANNTIETHHSMDFGEYRGVNFTMCRDHTASEDGEVLYRSCYIDFQLKGLEYSLRGSTLGTNHVRLLKAAKGVVDFLLDGQDYTVPKNQRKAPFDISPVFHGGGRVTLMLYWLNGRHPV